LTSESSGAGPLIFGFVERETHERIILVHLYAFRCIWGQIGAECSPGVAPPPDWRLELVVAVADALNARDGGVDFGADGDRRTLAYGLVWLRR